LIKIPAYIKKFALKFSVFLLMFTLCRILFYIFNSPQFSNVGIWDFFIGFLFDIVTTAIVFLPLVVIELFPNQWRGNKVYQLILKVLFFIVLFFSILMNLADIEYFKFSSSRSNISTIKMMSYGNDFSQQLPSFIKDFWYLFIIAFVVMGGAWWLYKKIDKLKDDSKEISWFKQSVWFVIMAVLIVMLGRGTGLRPIEPINITKYVKDQNVSLALNSTFTIIKSWGKQALKEKDYFSDEELKQIFYPIHKYDNQKELNQPNVVIIMLESFSVEFIASINGTKEINTPFLDSLFHQSLVFTNCYANGKKSIDAVPSIISSIPKLMNQEFITSIYATNQIESIPKHLKSINYETAFFHGATNGSMNFDQFAQKVGFDHYFGRNEYNNDKDFDGTWGIYDEEFFKWSADQMSQLKAPFFTTIFSLSSHPPYAIPEKYNGKFVGGHTPMHNSVKYTDYALQQFFAYAKAQPWYNNTLFIVTADHTPASGTPEYFKDMGNMHIPLVFFHPTDSTFKGVNNKVVGQIDIMPTIFDLIGYDKKFYAFGHSIFSEECYSPSYVNNKYLMFGKNHLYTFLNDKHLGLYNLKDKLLDPNCYKEQKSIADALEKMLKAYIQTYHKDLINNTMTVSE
jgi:phosphoglycerol transferase MdoB-like AlkP superfamily enzyme